jgi:hypothetical protein
MRDPALARDTAIARYAQSVHQDVDEKRLEMLRRYIILATRMAGPPPAPAGIPMPLPGGAGAPLPNLAPPIQQAAAAGAAPGAGPPAPSGPMPQDLAAAAPQPAPPVAPVA